MTCKTWRSWSTNCLSLGRCRRDQKGIVYAKDAIEEYITKNGKKDKNGEKVVMCPYSGARDPRRRAAARVPCQ